MKNNQHISFRSHVTQRIHNQLFRTVSKTATQPYPTSVCVCAADNFRKRGNVFLSNNFFVYIYAPSVSSSININQSKKRSTYVENSKNIFIFSLMCWCTLLFTNLKLIFISRQTPRLQKIAPPRQSPKNISTPITAYCPLAYM